MATHMATCPSDLKDTLANGYIIPWYRVRQFQQVSLLLILKRVYAVAASRKRRTDQFHHKEDETRKPLAMRPPRGGAPYHLYVSKHNEGAMAVVELLQHSLRKRTGKELLVTEDPSEMGGRRVEHFLFLVSASLFDAYESNDDKVAAKPNALFTELRIALRLNVHVVVVHDCRDSFKFKPKTDGPRPSRVTSPTAAVIVGTPKGNVRRSRGKSVRDPRFSHWTSLKSGADSPGQPGRDAGGDDDHDGEQAQEGDVIGRFAPFSNIHSRTPIELVKLSLFQELALPLYGVDNSRDPYASVSIDIILRSLLTLKSHTVTPLIQGAFNSEGLLAVSRFAQRWIERLRRDRGRGAPKLNRVADSSVWSRGRPDGEVDRVSSVDDVDDAAQLMAGKADRSSDLLHEEEAAVAAVAAVAAAAAVAAGANGSGVEAAHWPWPPFVSHVDWPSDRPPFISHARPGNWMLALGGASGLSGPSAAPQRTQLACERRMSHPQQDSSRASARASNASARTSQVAAARASMDRADMADRRSRPSQSKRTTSMSALMSGRGGARPAMKRASTGALGLLLDDSARGAGRSASAKDADKDGGALLQKGKRSTYEI
jgi:hypothetical protein